MTIPVTYIPTQYKAVLFAYREITKVKIVGWR